MQKWNINKKENKTQIDFELSSFLTNIKLITPKKQI